MKQLLYYNTQRTFTQARDFCKEKTGQKLAFPITLFETGTFLKFAKSEALATFWIDALYNAAEKAWSESNGCTLQASSH